MNNTQFKDLLREQAYITDKNWNPTDRQLDLIRNEIDRRIRSGSRISYSELQGIILRICGSFQCMVFSSVDNSDLNALLASATKK